MTNFLTSNTAVYRLLRTILQGIIGVLIANLDVIVASWNFDPSFKPMIVALVMAILSPIMAMLGEAQKDGDPDVG